MSVRAMSWALDQPVDDPAAKLLLVALANFADEKHTCFPGQELLAACLCRSVDTVQRLLKKLKHKYGVIEIERRISPQGYRTSNLYRLKVQVAVGLTGGSSIKPNPKPQIYGLGQFQSRKLAEAEPQQRTEPKPQLSAVGTINNHHHPSSRASARRELQNLKSETEAIEARAFGLHRPGTNAAGFPYPISPKTLTPNNVQWNAWLEFWGAHGRADWVTDAINNGTIVVPSLWPPSGHQTLTAGAA